MSRSVNPNPPRWTPEEDQFIRNNIELLTQSDIALKLGRTAKALSVHLSHLRKRDLIPPVNGRGAPKRPDSPRHVSPRARNLPNDWSAELEDVSDYPPHPVGGQGGNGVTPHSRARSEIHPPALAGGTKGAIIALLTNLTFEAGRMAAAIDALEYLLRAGDLDPAAHARLENDLNRLISKAGEIRNRLNHLASG